MTSGFTSDDGAAEFTLKHALLVYQSQTEARVIVRRHEVGIGEPGGELQLGSARFVTRDFIAALIDSLNLAKLQILPAHILAASTNAMAWHEPAQTRHMFFDDASDKASEAFSGCAIAQPALVFVAHVNNGYGSLKVFALPSDERPTGETILCHAPYWNIYADGRMCTGSTPLPDTIDADDTNAWSSAFFVSAFTHISSTGRWTGGITYAELLQHVIAKGAFEPTWLVSAKVNLRSAIAGS